MESRQPIHGGWAARPRAHARRRALWVALLALLVASRVASGPRAIPFPILMRIEGFVGAKPAGVKSLARWVVAIDGARVTFHVTKLEPRGVDIAYWTILNQLEPLPITLTVYGDPLLLHKFREAAPGMPIAVVGNFVLGPGPATLLLESVDTLPWPTTGAAVATPCAAPAGRPTAA